MADEITAPSPAPAADEMRDHYDFTDAKRAPETDGGQGLVDGLLVIADQVDAMAHLLEKEGHKFSWRNRVREAAARLTAMQRELDEVKAREVERAIAEPVAYRWMAPDYSGFMYGIAHGDLPEHCRPIPLYAEPQGPPDLEGTVTFLGKALVKATAATVAERQAREAAEDRLREAEKDAERYRWLRGRNELTDDVDPRGPYTICDDEPDEVPSYPTGEQLDAAIDSAKGREQGGA